MVDTEVAGDRRSRRALRCSASSLKAIVKAFGEATPTAFIAATI